MKRRTALGILGGAIFSPFVAGAQQAGKLPRLGMLSPGPEASVSPYIEAVLSGLRSAGFATPAQIELVWRGSDAEPGKITPLVTEILATNPDVFLAIGPAVLQTVRTAAQSIPIIAIDLESDPVENGTVASLSHPGGNTTGVFLAFPDFTTKWLQLLKETAPGLSLVTVLWDPSTGLMQQNAISGAAKLLGVNVDIIEVHSRADFDRAFNSASDRGSGALLMLSSPIFTAGGGTGRRLAELALAHRLLAISLFPDFARAGGLLAYGPNVLDIYRQAGGMIAKVLHGSKAGDLPIERPSKFELVVNTRTAKALEIVFPTSVLVRADEVIE